MSGGTGYGITDQGFVLPQLTDLKTDLEQGLINQFGAGINLAPSSFFGQFVGLTAERLSLVWQAMQDVYSSQTPDTAFGASLDNVGALRGIPRLGATFSVVQNVRIFGTPGTPVPNTFQVSVEGAPLSVFQIGGAVTLQAGQNCIQTIMFSALPAAGNWTLSLNGSVTPVLPFNATAAQVQTAIQTLNFASGCTVVGSMAAGFTVTFNGEATGGLMVQPQFGVATNTLETAVPVAVAIVTAITQAGIDQANIQFTATAEGPTAANASSLNVIVTPISGVDAVLNTQDATLGSYVETDNAYRLRMAEELQVAGAGTVPAIRARLLTVAGVTSALVYENVSDITDAFNRPPHSFEAVVSGGTDSDIANMIWQVKPAGIATYGTSSFDIVDSQGITHTIYFSRPAIIDIYIDVTITKNSAYPADGDTLVKEALANYINGLGQGVSVIVNPLLVAQLAPIPGIDDTVILIGKTPGPTLPDNIAIAAFEQAFTQTDFINVTDVNG